MTINSYQDARREGAKTALRALASRENDFLTHSFVAIVLTGVVAHLNEEKEKLYDMNTTFYGAAERVEVLSKGYRDGVATALDKVKEYDIAFITDEAMDKAIQFARIHAFSIEEEVLAP